MRFPLLALFSIGAALVAAQPPYGQQQVQQFVSFEKKQPATKDRDACILLIGGQPRRSPFIEYFHPSDRECDLEAIGQMSDARLKDTVETSGCYLADSHQVLIRDFWSPSKPPILYELGGDRSVKELPFPYVRRNEFRPTFRSSTTAISPTKCLSCGGTDGISIKLCYLFDSSRPSNWTQLASMPSEQAGVATVLISGGKQYYAIGGSFHESGTGKELYRYDIQQNKWFKERPMSRSRERHSAVALSDSEFIACGGYGKDAYSTCEVYNSRFKMWRRAGSLNVGRAEFAMVSFNGQIYALGGVTEDNEQLKTVEIYDIAKDKWTIINKRLQRGRHAFVGIVVKDDPNFGPTVSPF